MPSKRRYIKIKYGKFRATVTSRDMMAIAVFVALAMQFALLLLGKVDEAEKLGMFLGGYGLGWLMQNLVIGGRNEKKQGSTRRIKKPRRRPSSVR